MTSNNYFMWQQNKTLYRASSYVRSFFRTLLKLRSE
nr:MAG TPA: hypothetical protein [Caudoviricetes sp.]